MGTGVLKKGYSHKIKGTKLLYKEKGHIQIFFFFLEVVMKLLPFAW